MIKCSGCQKNNGCVIKIAAQQYIDGKPEDTFFCGLYESTLTGITDTDGPTIVTLKPTIKYYRYDGEKIVETTEPPKCL